MFKGARAPVDGYYRYHSGHLGWADVCPLIVRVVARLVERALSNLILKALRYARSRVQVILTRDTVVVWPAT
ncbi:hypothetical protein [Pyxidicoccus sp. MSG2]|uniref:hypothetical protein n=1 Tax=Pyxidicoccus sp. MSG2 TaxID=2996790 RepID=UPI00226F028A|nr:hypothetical protein [Pyxidicoccus sp. MSG2]MCY1019115.1 hypothetical protein [Pyxidicoccus sp. MSG2]